MMMTSVPVLRTSARQGSLLCKSGPIDIVTFYLITRHNSVLITEGLGLKCLYTSICMETPSLEVLQTKAKEDPSPHEMRLSPTDINPVFHGCYYYFYYYCYHYCYQYVINIIGLYNKV